MSSLDFTIGSTREEDADAYADPIRFSLNGHVFEAMRKAPGGLVYDMITPARTSARANTDAERSAAQADAAASQLDFLAQVLVPESWGRFDALFHSIDDPIDAAEMSETITKLCEVYAGRPTAPPARSSAPHRRTGTSSTVTARGGTSIPDDSASTGS